MNHSTKNSILEVLQEFKKAKGLGHWDLKHEKDIVEYIKEKIKGDISEDKIQEIIHPYLEKPIKITMAPPPIRPLQKGESLFYVRIS
jgi:hypothetical protein